MWWCEMIWFSNHGKVLLPLNKVDRSVLRDSLEYGLKKVLKIQKYKWRITIANNSNLLIYSITYDIISDLPAFLMLFLTILTKMKSCFRLKKISDKCCVCSRKIRRSQLNTHPISIHRQSDRFYAQCVHNHVVTWI